MTKQRIMLLWHNMIQDPANLTLLTEAAATKTLFEGESPNLIATGVAFIHEGGTKIAEASKKIILAAADGDRAMDYFGRCGRLQEALGKAMTAHMTMRFRPFSRAAITFNFVVPVAEGQEEINNLLSTYRAISSESVYHVFVRSNSLPENSEQGSGMVFMYGAPANFGKNSANFAKRKELTLASSLKTLSQVALCYKPPQ
ncbi:3939e4e8-c2e1-42cf-a80f-f3746b8bf7de [Sclerotinia trifoliorum]|uniref:3939e4e8-c2e1-42cf-a80f-f3746b8bf7de n=1 Tax=Sclerotinia trifoliorum TaxID=28548 RepID=A0A8H2ZVY4_9HELO|nr:3939e4e8-c2e1-42cf-a80f-f3746b8bf7de [Sclerotinia trifoliorum]